VWKSFHPYAVQISRIAIWTQCDCEENRLGLTESVLKSDSRGSQTFLLIPIVPHNQPIAILLKPELQWLSGVLERKNHDSLVHVLEGRLQPNLQAAEWLLIRLVTSNVPELNIVALSQTEGVLICQPTYVIWGNGLKGQSPAVSKPNTPIHKSEPRSFFISFERFCSLTCWQSDPFLQKYAFHATSDLTATPSQSTR